MQTPEIRGSGKVPGHFKPEQLKLALRAVGLGCASVLSWLILYNNHPLPPPY
jgi:hypothetical protein